MILDVQKMRGVSPHCGEASGGLEAQISCNGSLCAAGLAALVFAPILDDFRVIIQGLAAAALLCGMLGVEAAGRLPRLGWPVLLGNAFGSCRVPG